LSTRLHLLDKVQVIGRPAAFLAELVVRVIGGNLSADSTIIGFTAIVAFRKCHYTLLFHAVLASVCVASHPVLEPHPPLVASQITINPRGGTGGISRVFSYSPVDSFLFPQKGQGFSFIFSPCAVLFTRLR
jgi:hypothetical protein